LASELVNGRYYLEGVLPVGPLRSGDTSVGGRFLIETVGGKGVSADTPERNAAFMAVLPDLAGEGIHRQPPRPALPPAAPVSAARRAAVVDPPPDGEATCAIGWLVAPPLTPPGTPPANSDEGGLRSS